MSENKSQKKRIWFITILILLVLLLISLFASERRGKIVYREYLSEDILTVDGEKLQLGDLAMYIAYEELKVRQQPMIIMIRISIGIFIPVEGL